MSRLKLLYLTPVLGLLLAVTPAQAADTPSREHEVDLSLRQTGDKQVRGPVRLKIKNFNPLRYTLTVQEAYAAPNEVSVAKLWPFLDLGAAATPAAGGSGAAEAATAKEKVKRTLGSLDSGGGGKTLVEDCATGQACLRELKSGVEELRTLRLKALAGKPEQEREVRPLELFLAELAKLKGSLETLKDQAEVVTEQSKGATTGLVTAAAATEELLRSADAWYATPAGGAIAQEKLTQTLGTINAALEPKWPADAVAEALETAKEAKKSIEDLKYLPGWSAAVEAHKIDKDHYRQLGASVEAAIAKLQALGPDSDAAKAYKTAKAVVEAWKARLEPVLAALQAPDALFRSIPVHCNYPWTAHRQQTYVFRLTDLLEKDEAKATVEAAKVVVVCPAVFSLTGGLSYTGVEDRKIGRVQGKKETTGADGKPVVTLEDRFGYTQKGGEQMTVAGLIHTRFADRNRYNFHATGGVAFDLDDSKLTVGYILGLSMSISDGIFVTVGTQAMRVPKLAGGFVIGDAIPSALTDDSKFPIEKEWDLDWMVGVTYKLN